MADEITATKANNRSEPDLETGKVAPETKEDDKPLDYIRSIGGREVEKVAVLSFRALQLQRIAALQAKLVTKQCDVMRNREGMDEDDIDRLLQKYADAIRNYETLTQNIVSSKIEDYKFLGEGDKFRVIKREKSGPKIRSELSQSVESDVPDIGSLGFRELDKRRRVERESRGKWYLRLQMALFGGVALIAPMLIMALHPGRTVDLVTTSVATVIFVIFIVVWNTDASGMDVLTSTAAYAAVLVVFVGANLAPAS